MLSLRLVLCLLVAVVGTGTVYANTFFVAVDGDDGNPGSKRFPFATLQRAVDEADDSVHPGPDTIMVAPGEYTENVTIDDADSLTVKGAGAGATVVHADDATASVVSILSGDVTIRDMTFRDGANGIAATGHSLTLVRVEAIENAPVDDDTGNGLCASDLDRLTVHGGNYSNNGGEVDDEAVGEGLRIDEVAQVVLNDVTADSNEDDGADVDDVGSLRVANGTFTNNVDGDGLKIDDTISIDIVGGTYSSQADGDGIDFADNESIRIVGVTAANNGDEAIEVDDCGSIAIIASTISDNGDDGIDADDTRSVTLINVLSSGNTGNGLQIEAEEDQDTDLVLVVNSQFFGNGEDGIKVVEESSVVNEVRLKRVTAQDNAESGFDVVISGILVLQNITSVNNGEADILSP